jgi:hypothetical protein
MADDVNSYLECGLKTLLDIMDPISTLRNIFVNLKNSGEEQSTKINQLAGLLKKSKAEIRKSKVTNLTGRALPSRGGIGQTSYLQHANSTAIYRRSKETSLRGSKIRCRYTSY